METWWAKRARKSQPGVLDPKFAHLFTRSIGRCIRAFHRPSFEGFETLPRDEPYILIANHSGGAAASEIFSLIDYGCRHQDFRIAGMAHPFALSIWPISKLMCAIGAIPSTTEHGLDALSARIPVLLFPGGAHEATRPIWQANRVDFAGHQGFIRLAKAANVPIIPLGIRGSHYSVPILWRSRLLAKVLIVPRLLGIKQWPLTALALSGLMVGSIMITVVPWPLWLLGAWCWLLSPLSLMPIVPSTIRFRVGAPITCDGTDTECAQGVMAAVQELVTESTR